MEKTLKELADFVEGEVIGDGNAMIKGVKTIDNATEGYITFVSNTKYEKRIDDTKATAIIVSPHLKRTDKLFLVSSNPYLAFAKIVDLMMHQKPVYSKIIDPGAKIGENVTLGNDVTIFQNVFVGANTKIGNNAVLYPGVYIGEGCEIGEFTEIYPNTVIYKECKIGKRVTIHSNASIGSPGFGYAPSGNGFYKVPHVGITVIEDDVDIEPNTVISRAVLGETRVKSGSKIGSLAAIGHNVEIGRNTLIVSQAGIAGSAKIGNNVTIAGQSGINGHITIGDNVTIGGRSGVSNDLPPGGTYLGVPAMPIQKTRKSFAIFGQLPEMRDTIKSLNKRIEMLEKARDTENS